MKFPQVGLLLALTSYLSASQAASRFRGTETVTDQTDGDGEFWSRYVMEERSMTDSPTGAPTLTPSFSPSVLPSVAPSTAPSEETEEPSLTPSLLPSGTPSIATESPSSSPTEFTVTNSPTDRTDSPSGVPSSSPTASPSVSPSSLPSLLPSLSPSATTDAPTTSTETPSETPSTAPTPSPTTSPTPSPTDEPTSSPSAAPSLAPQPPVVQQRLLPFALQGGLEFEDPTSYQSSALARTEEQVEVDTFTDAKLVQYYALYCIYTATNGVSNPITDSDPNFADSDEIPGWNVNVGWNQTDVDPCDGWFGVACDLDGRVQSFSMVDNNMTGSFPPEITLLASDGPRASGAGNLNYLELFNNMYLFNNFDSSWVSDLGSNLHFLFLGITGFAGDLPVLPSGVRDVDLSFALWDGGFEDSIFTEAQGLEYAVFGGSSFNTTVPTILGALPNLEFLYISECFLKGDLSYMENMTSIREHWIDNNPEFGGPIFEFIGNLSTLESFSVTQSALTGTIPSVLSNLVNMQQMWFYSNELTGTVPSELGRLQLMSRLQLEDNDLTGNMPEEICDNLTFLGALKILGGDCFDDNFECSCCTCCSVTECNE